MTVFCLLSNLHSIVASCVPDVLINVSSSSDILLCVRLAFAHHARGAMGDEIRIIIHIEWQ